MKPLLDLRQNGYYIILPTYTFWSEIPFHHRASELSLLEMQTIVGGYIEAISISGAADGIVNEEGKLKNLPVNILATELYSHLNDHIVGTMLVLCGKARLK